MSTSSAPSILRRWLLQPGISASGSRRNHMSQNPSPLRILFCGSDTFSCASLEALVDLQRKEPTIITSIDVMCRPGKAAGRGMKEIREVPVKALASKLGLPIHERDTFIGWDIPSRDGQPINLLVAVSFGLFVPPRILNSLEYGGLNIHPSLLPDLRGPAPLHHTLLNGDSETGITLQTLDPHKFDHGKILLQRRLPVPERKLGSTAGNMYNDLLQQAAEQGPLVLVEGIRKGLYRPAIDPSSSGTLSASLTSDVVKPDRVLRHAPKITNAMREINFQTMSMQELDRRDLVLGRCWTLLKEASTGKLKRVVFSGFRFEFMEPDRLSELEAKAENEKKSLVGVMIYDSNGEKYRQVMFSAEHQDGSNKNALHIPIGAAHSKSGDGRWVLIVNEITVEGEKRKSALQAIFTADHLRKREQIAGPPSCRWEV